MPEHIDILIHALQRQDPDNSSTDWSVSFLKYLDTILTKLLGSKASISLTDKDLTIAKEQLERSKLVVVLESEVGQSDEGATALLNSIAESEKFPDNVFRVRKHSFEDHEAHELLEGHLVYDLKITDGSAALSEHFWMKLVDLAYELKRKLQSSQIDNSTSSTVYLALTSFEQAPIRDVIYRELRRHGYRVLPDRALPRGKEAQEKAIEEALSRSILSIHIIGENAVDQHAVLNGEEEELTIVDIQNSIASRYCDRHNDKFQRLIWFSPELGLDSEEQLLYIERLKRDTKALIGAELIQTPLEKLKSIIKRRLKLIAEGYLEKTEVVSNNDKLKVYLICDKEDQEKSKKLKGWLEDHGYEVLLPSFDGKQLSLLHSHRRNLAICDAALIYHGHQNARWVQMKMLDLLKAPGYGRTKPMVAQGLFIEEDLDVTPNAQLKNLTVLDPGEPSLDHLGPFFQKLNKNG